MPRYEPQNIPEDIDDLQEFLNREFRRVADMQDRIPVYDGIEYKVYITEPLNPQTGQIYYADGSGWNPGAGEGLYERTSAPAWVKL